MGTEEEVEATKVEEEEVADVEGKFSAVFRWRRKSQERGSGDFLGHVVVDIKYLMLSYIGSHLGDAAGLYVHSISLSQRHLVSELNQPTNQPYVLTYFGSLYIQSFSALVPLDPTGR